MKSIPGDWLVIIWKQLALSSVYFFLKLLGGSPRCFWVCFLLFILYAFLHLPSISSKFHIQTFTFSLIVSLIPSESLGDWEITQIYSWGKNFIVFHKPSHLCSGRCCLKILIPIFENLSNNNIFSLIYNGRNYNRK